MQNVAINNLTLWQFKNLAAQPLIRHFVTDRNSNGEGGEFTLSFSSSPHHETIEQNRHLLAQAMGLADTSLYLPSQVHKTNVLRVTSSTTRNDLLETDALITNETGICIAVMSADCVPIVIYDTLTKAIAAVHAGWRGTVNKILEKTLYQMHEAFGTNGEHIVAGIGPSVSQDSYEVGGEVMAEVELAFGKENGLMIKQSHNKAKLDLWQANKLQLLKFGVKEANIETSDLCSVKNNHHFFSARKGDNGRYAAGIMII